MPDTGITDNSTVFTSSLWDTYVRQQVVAQVTSSTRPTNVEGRLIYETDTDLFLAGSGSAWQAMLARVPVTYTPTFSNVTSGAGTFTYAYAGPNVIFIRADFSAGTVTAGGLVAFSLPSGMTAATGDQTLNGRNGVTQLCMTYTVGDGNIYIRKDHIGTAWAGAEACSGLSVTGWLQIA